jgi:hypothetical protein
LVAGSSSSQATGSSAATSGRVSHDRLTLATSIASDRPLI